MNAIKNSIGVATEVVKYVNKAKRPNENLESLKVQWASGVLSRLRIDLEIVGAPSLDGSLLLVGNHLSYLDIPLLLRTSGAISFVAKQEISSWPLFGTGARKLGAFEIAHQFNILIQPFRLSYSPLEEVAFIGQDALPMHLYNLFCFERKNKKIRAKIEFHEPVAVTDPENDSKKWQSWSRGLLGTC